jgi:hypothetical protein
LPNRLGLFAGNAATSGASVSVTTASMPAGLGGPAIGLSETRLDFGIQKTRRTPMSFGCRAGLTPEVGMSDHSTPPKGRKQKEKV